MILKNAAAITHALLCFIATGVCQSTQNPIPDKMMQDVYSKIKTPFKYGPVITPQEAAKKVDGPNIFKRGSLWYMVYGIYDESSYETWLAQSSDLLHWQTKGKIRTVADSAAWNYNPKAGPIALLDILWGGTYAWQKYNNRYWMSYSGSKNSRAAAGMLYSYADPASVHEWQQITRPVLQPSDPDAHWSENNAVSAGVVIRDNEKNTGRAFIMYYTARGDSTNPARGPERINMAVSDDMTHWARYGDNPVINHQPGTAADAAIQKIDNLYVMFYSGADRNEKQQESAFNHFACSYDLIHWTDWTGQHLISPSEPYDQSGVGKPCVIRYNGVVYHYYCATNKNQQLIALATSVNLGKNVAEQGR